MDLNILRGIVKELRIALEEVKPRYEEVQEEYLETLARWKNAVTKLEQEDFKQALIDGRTKRVKHGENPIPMKTIASMLTKEQIKEIVIRFEPKEDK